MRNFILESSDLIILICPILFSRFQDTFLSLDLCSLTFNACGFVNDFLNCGATRFKSKAKLILLASKTIIDSLYLCTLFKSTINVCLSQGNFIFIFFLEFTKLCALEVWFDCKPDLHPQPGLGCEVVPDCSLTSIQSKFLILELLEIHS